MLDNRSPGLGLALGWVIAAAAVAVFLLASYKGTIGLNPVTATLLADLAARKPTILISFGSPYIISQVPTAGSYLIAWSNSTMTEAAVGAALTGRNGITGTTPTPIPPMFPIHSGLVRMPIAAKSPVP